MLHRMRPQRILSFSALGARRHFDPMTLATMAPAVQLALTAFEGKNKGLWDYKMTRMPQTFGPDSDGGVLSVLKHFDVAGRHGMAFGLQLFDMLGVGLRGMSSLGMIGRHKKLDHMVILCPDPREMKEVLLAAVLDCYKRNGDEICVNEILEILGQHGYSVKQGSIRSTHIFFFGNYWQCLEVTKSR